MSYKEIIKGKYIYLCDVCGNEMSMESMDKLSMTVGNQWWKIAHYEHLDICSKHKKVLMKFIKELKDAKE